MAQPPPLSIVKGSDQLARPPTRKLKLLSFVLQCSSNYRTVLAKILVKKQVKSRFFYLFAPWLLSIFKPRTCILHHFAFLVGRQLEIFQPPNSHFLPLKSHFFTAILPLLAMCFIVPRGFVYAIGVNVYAFCLAFSCILHCVQHQNTLRLAPKQTVFCTKTHCIQHQNVLLLAPKCSVFSGKTHKSRCKWRFV